MTRALLFQNNVPKKYWSDAILCATHLINRLPSVVLKNKSPLEVLYQQKTNLDHLRVFGCVCFVHIKRKDKFDYMSTKTIFLGYSSFKKGYKCYDPINKTLFVSRDVIFCEDEPYFKNIYVTEKIYDNDQFRPVIPQVSEQNVIPNMNYENEINNHEEEINEDNNENNSSDEDLENIVLRRSTRTHQPFTRLRDFVTYTVRYPIQDFVSYKNISPLYNAFLTSIEKEVEPNTYQEAIMNPVWCKAMKDELQALEKK